jgi:superfamily II DNA/RNA helicase
MSSDTTLYSSPASAANSVTVSFDELGLIPPLLARLTELEYQQPTPIQAQAICKLVAVSCFFLRIFD